MGKFFVDRINNNNVFCEDENGDEIKFDISAASGKITEGDVIFKDENGVVKTDVEATLVRKKKISNLKKYIYKTKK